MARREIIFDLETIPLPEDVIFSQLEPFDPDSVKIGNRGPDKAAEYIEKCRAEHKARALEKAALSALTGQIAMIGYHDGKEPEIHCDAEPVLINEFFRRFLEYQRDEMCLWVGFNIASFDLPFLLRRAWAWNIEPPRGLVKGRFLSSWFIDLLDTWRACGDHRELISLDRLAKFLGVGSKNGATGLGFAALLYESKQKAVEYLANDLHISWAIADRLGVIGRQVEEEKCPSLTKVEPAKQEADEIAFF
jgi:hypothetical protein